MTERENSICSTGAPEEVWERAAEIADEERVEKLGKAYTGVKCITGENSRLIFADPTTAQRAEAELGSNPLDWLGFKPFENADEPVYVEMPRDEFFGGEESRTFWMGFPKDVNLYTLLAAIDEGFEVTGDLHHTFFEGFELDTANHPLLGSILVITPILGS